MSDKSNPYERVKGGRLTFKGGALASRSNVIDKKKKKKNKSKIKDSDQVYNPDEQSQPSSGAATVDYTIDAAKKMKYDELFPVEAKKFEYDPKAKSKSVEEALDDRIKKKADRYCK